MSWKHWFAAVIKPVTSWFEGLPLSSLAYQNTKELVDLSSPDLTAEEVKCDAADAQGETLHFLSSLNEMRQTLLI